jgi:hypothetical protein
MTRSSETSQGPMQSPMPPEAGSRLMNGGLVALIAGPITREARLLFVVPAVLVLLPLSRVVVGPELLPRLGFAVAAGSVVAIALGLYIRLLRGAASRQGVEPTGLAAWPSKTD